MSEKLTLVFALLVFGGAALTAEKTWVGRVSDTNCRAKHAAADDNAATCLGKSSRAAANTSWPIPLTARYTD